MRQEEEGEVLCSSGLILSSNEKIHNFLLSVASDQNVTKEHQQIAANLSRETCIPYKSIRKIWFESSPSTRTNLVDLLNGSDFVLSSPKPREKSDELKERLRKLADLAERSEYRELVKDITPKEANEPFSSYKDQIGFGK
ncbi:hypothetical protein GIB67_018881 [Kingdonia uniflora]|uniref:Uncharacterized protein n=1 Tax=Kingdonia uniflora TaxID=39325 RepID=A0A7J7MYU2_9MAGN|nr:hypothetical protein GIB67_018881 [Kingdonia uniflora]